MRAHDDDAEPGDDRQRVAPLAQQRAGRRGGGAERDEHGGEAGDEQQRGDDDVAPRAAVRPRPTSASIDAPAR